MKRLMYILNDLPLGKKIALLATLWLILAVGVFSFLAIRAVNQATEMMLQDRLATAHVEADYLDQALGRALLAVENTAQAMEIDTAKAELKLQMQTLKNILSYSRFSIQGIHLTNGTGQIILSEPNELAVMGASISYDSGITQALSEGKGSISDLVPAPLAGTPVVLLVSPTREGQQGAKGILVVELDAAESSISSFVRPITLGRTGYIEVVEGKGIVIARTEPGATLSPFEKSDHSGRFVELITAGQPTRGVCHNCHEAVQKVETRDVLAFAPLTKAHWGVVVRQSEEEALDPVRKLRQNLILTGVGLITITLVGVIVTTQDVANRIRLLTTASQRIAGGDFVNPIATSSRKDEVGILANTFEDMRTKLKASYSELEQRTKELSAMLSVSEILSSLSNLSDLDTTLGNALDKALETMESNIGGILLLDEEKQVLRYRVYRGLSEKYAQEMYLSLGEGIAGRVAKTGESILLEDISTEPSAAHPELIAAERLRGFASIPLRLKDKVLGVLNIASRDDRKFSSQDMRLLEGISGQIATAIENARLHQEVQRKDEIRGELLREIFSIQEEERRRIARELHDETSQVLASLNASLEVAASLLPDNADKVRSIVTKAQALSVTILDEIHRLIYELRPTLLDDLGLVSASRWLADSSLRAIGIKASFKTIGREKRLPPNVEVTLFRIIQEALANIVRHAHAKNVEIVLRFKKGAIEVNVNDDGEGFEVKEAINPEDRPRGLGLLGMKERVELLNGTLNIRSRPKGGGTEIEVKIPLS